MPVWPVLHFLKNLTEMRENLASLKGEQDGVLGTTEDKNVCKRSSRRDCIGKAKLKKSPQSRIKEKGQKMGEKSKLKEQSRRSALQAS